MKIVRQSVPVIRNSIAAGISEGVLQSSDCGVCRQMHNGTARSFCLNMVECGEPVYYSPPI